MELLENIDNDKRKSINFKKEIQKYLKKWPWFLLSMALFYTGAQIYLRYAVPLYLSKTALKLQESKNTNSALGDLKNLGMGVSGDAELQGETTVIVSKPILMQVAENLRLDVSFISEGKIKSVELYRDSPVEGRILQLFTADRFSGASYEMTPVGNNSYRLTGISRVFHFGTPAVLPFGKVLLSLKPGATLAAPVTVVFKNMKNVAAGLEGSISVALPPNKGMLMELSMVGPVPAKSEDILNEVAKQYNIDGVKDKNLEAQNTQDFIDGRLNIITGDLSGIEGRIETFKRDNQITNLETQASNALSNVNENTKAVLNQNIQLELINSVIGAVGSAGDQLLPSGMGLPAGAESNITKYNDMVLTRNRVLKQATGENPAVIQMNKDIAVLKSLIRKNLIESRETLMVQVGQLQGQINADRDRVSRYPAQEKINREIERQRGLKEQLYLYLLQKREENAITLAVTAPKAKVVNPAFTIGQVKPNSKQILTGALAAGFVLPALVMFLLFSLDTKIHRRDDILQYIPDAMVIAEIPVIDEVNAIVHPKDFSIFAESFRILASNLKFLIKTKKSDGHKGVILVTSSVKGEGKTTIAMNLALTLASKNKVLLLGADIRNPQLHRFIPKENVGLTQYLVSDDNDPAAYVKPSGLSENLDVMFSGAIAPNPNDLLDMEKFDDLINGFRRKYEYVIVDTAPVMLVSDTRHILDNADAVLYVVKSDYSERETMDFAADFKKTNNIKNLAFVLNNVTPENTRYGKKYGYGYYAYGTDKEMTFRKKKKWKLF